MKFNPNVHHRRSIRLPGYDYGQSNAYFVTICALQKECVFGQVINGEMELNEIGKIIRHWWNEIPKHFVHAEIEDAYVIMPNHFHGIIWIRDPVGAGSPRPVPTDPHPTDLHIGTRDGVGHGEGGETPPLPKKRTLGQVMGFFKYQSTKYANQMRGLSGIPLWQRNYFERIIRSDYELHAVMTYILDNPLKWAMDPENPLNKPK